RRRRTSVAIATAYFLITLAPALGLLNFSTMLYSYVADHYQYLASIGWIALAGGMFSAALCRMNGPARRFGYGAMAILIGTISILTWKASADYKDSESLFRKNFRKNP